MTTQPKVRCSWRSSQDAKRGERLRRDAKGKAKATRKRNRPSLCVLRTWAMICDAMRRIAKVAAKGLELHVEFQGKIYVIKKAGDSLGIFHNKLTASGNT